MRRIVLAVIAFALVTLPGILMQPALAVTLVTGDGERLTCSPVMPGSALTLEFTHSMYGGFVREMYRIEPDGELHRLRFVTENAAAAEYYATDGRTLRANDGWEVLAPPFTTRELVIRVDDRGDHRITIDGISRHLAAEFSESTQVRIGTERASPLSWRAPCPSSDD